MIENIPATKIIYVQHTYTWNKKQKNQTIRATAGNQHEALLFFLLWKTNALFVHLTVLELYIWFFLLMSVYITMFGPTPTTTTISLPIRSVFSMYASMYVILELLYFYFFLFFEFICWRQENREQTRYYGQFNVIILHFFSSTSSSSVVLCL